MIPTREQAGDRRTDPEISIVIACVNGLPYIERCLASIDGQDTNESFEVIVADRCNTACREAVERYRWATRITAAHDRATIPELRALAIRRSRGKIIAITEDHCVAPPGWLKAIVQAHAEGHRIVGGPVTNEARQRVVDWAVFFCEYSAFMPPKPRGPGRIPGNNTSYDRTLLPLIDDLLAKGRWEEDYNARLISHGNETFMDPAAVIGHLKSFRVSEFLLQRYHYARSFAGMRLQGAPLYRRFCWAAAASSILPALLYQRILRNVLASGRHRRELMLATPLLLAFVSIWGLGESVGYVLGPGHSLAKVE